MSQKIFRPLLILPLTVLTIATAMVGCQKATNPDRGAPQAAPVVQIVASADQQVEFKSKVDILFVIDDSESMEQEQTAISQNINRFADGLGKLLDWRVGVTTVWEAWARDQSRPRWSPANLFPGRNVPYAPQSRGGLTMAPGQLLPVMNPDAPDQILPFSDGRVGNIGRRWIDRNSTYGNNTSEDAYITLLRSHLKVGFRTFESGGPRWEQILYPVLAALSPNRIDLDSDGAAGDEVPGSARRQVQYYNQGFFRQDSLIVIIMISDVAADSSSEDVSDVIGALDSLRSNPEEYMTFLATAVSRTRGCQVDDEGERVTVSGARTKLRNLIRQTNGGSDANLFDLCSSDYGGRLASMGEDIRRRRGPIIFRLRDTPDTAANYPKLMYGDANNPAAAVEIEKSAGWEYDATQEAVIVSTDIRLPADGGPNLWVKTQAVDVTRRNIVYE